MNSLIHIYGASGSGTSTLGRALASALGYTFMDTDDYFWVPTDPPFTTKRSTEERLILLENDIAASFGTVLSGALTKWGDALIPRFTLAVRLVTDEHVRLSRLKAREHARFGDRICPGGDMYETHQAFLKWASAYDTGGLNMRSRADHDRWQTLLQCPQLVLDGERPVEENVRKIIEFCKEIKKD